MALAPLAHVLFTRVMRYDASRPEWPDRDRFILSNGHVSILHYSMLHLTGHGLTLDDLKQFRQWGSATPGHPENIHTAGIEVTTGPLGQGLANGVGMAIAERIQRAKYGDELSNHHIYVVAGDGCFSEGVSHEAASLAGHLGLGRLVVIYDDNHITIDGPTDLALSDDAAKRFESYGWDVNDIGEAGEDLDAIETALNRAKGIEDKPSVIIVRTHIGFPSPTLTDNHTAHGLAFGDEEIAAAKEAMGIPNEPFWVPEDVLAYYRKAGSAGSSESAAWDSRLAVSEHKVEWDVAWGSGVTEGWEEALPIFEAGTSVATRKASQAVVTALESVVPGFIGGSADLTGNTGTKLASPPQSPSTPAGRQINFGVREHAMGSALVGAALHGGTVPFAGTFLVFADYMRPAVRLAALSKAKCMFVWTHDSVGVGEDGPTHQPVEQVMSLRAIPGLQVIRPADGTEAVGAWKLAMSYEGPSALIMSRQNLPVLDTTSADAVSNGAYVLSEPAGAVATIVATGSEVSVAVEAASILEADGKPTRVVSMPCWETFENQPTAAKKSVLGSLPTVSVEAGITLGWAAYADSSVGIDRFGASAPGSVALDKLGINASNVVAKVSELL
jgi:transketolase